MSSVQTYTDTLQNEVDTRLTTRNPIIFPSSALPENPFNTAYSHTISQQTYHLWSSPNEKLSAKTESFYSPHPNLFVSHSRKRQFSILKTKPEYSLKNWKIFVLFLQCPKCLCISRMTVIQNRQRNSISLSKRPALFRMEFFRVIRTTNKYNPGIPES